MKIEFEGHHGNEIEKVNEACEFQKYHVSEGDSHWLGNGTYFFEDTPAGNGKLHADSWNYFEQNKGRRVNPAIYKVKVIVDEDRIFDLSKDEHCEIFELIKQRHLPTLALKLHQINQKRPTEKNLTVVKGKSLDGLIFNMWHKIVKKKPIDVIRKKDYYPTKIEQDLNVFSRVANVYVLCVRSKTCIYDATKI